MARHNSGKKIIGGAIWLFAERIGAKGVSFVVSILLARLLLPEVYGLIALVTAIINILEVFVDGGMGVALVQKKDADDLDFSTIFYFNILLSGLLYLGMFIAAPYIASFYGYPELQLVVKVLSVTLIISGIKNVEMAYTTRKMEFRKFFYATLAGTIGAAIIGIFLAYRGAGVWALVWQHIFNMLIDTVILWFANRWKPQKNASFTRFKQLFSFSSKLLLTKLVDAVYGELESLTMGKVFNSESLAYYNRARTFPQTAVLSINSAIDSALLPAIASEQDDMIRVKMMTKKAIQMSTYIIAPMMTVLLIVSPTLIKLLLNDNWIPCIPYVQAFCIAYLFYPINAANLNAIRAIGRSDIYFKLNVIKKVVGLVTLFIALQHSPLALAYSYLFNSVMGQIINSFPNKRILNYSYGEQLKDILPSLLLSAVMGLCIWGISFFQISDLLMMLLQVSLGLLFYLILSKMFRFTEFSYIMDIVKSFAMH